MKSISIAKLEEAAAARKPGYMEEVLRYATKVSDTHLKMPDQHFQRIRQKYSATASGDLPGSRPDMNQEPPTNGPGTELKRLLAKIGIHASPTCKCNAMAKKMNEWGPDESLKHMEEIIDVMEETAKKRKLPFLRTAAKVMVRAAIWKARKKHG